MSSAHLILEDESDLFSLSSEADLSFLGDNAPDLLDALDSPPAVKDNDHSPSQTFFCNFDWNCGASVQTSPQPPSTSLSRLDGKCQQQPARMVSVESMSRVTAAPSKPRHQSHTPLESLRLLVSQKKQHLQQQLQEQPASSLKRVASIRSTSSQGTRIASVLNNPSSVLQKFVADDVMPPAKKAKTEPASPTALHEACRRSNVTVTEIRDILQKDPKAAERSASLTYEKRFYNPVSKVAESVERPEPFCYPLNLAIRYQCSPAVLDALITASPAVLNLRDGVEQYTPLHILYRYQPPNFSAAADRMLLKQPLLAQCVDAKHHHTPLHYALSCGVDSVECMRHLVVLYPEALKQRNFHGKTPLLLAQQRSVNEAVVDYLWEQVDRQCLS